MWLRPHTFDMLHPVPRCSVPIHSRQRGSGPIAVAKSVRSRNARASLPHTNLTKMQSTDVCHQTFTQSRAPTHRWTTVPVCEVPHLPLRRCFSLPENGAVTLHDAICASANDLGCCESVRLAVLPNVASPLTAPSLERSSTRHSSRRAAIPPSQARFPHAPRERYPKLPHKPPSIGSTPFGRTRQPSTLPPRLSVRRRFARCCHRPLVPVHSG